MPRKKSSSKPIESPEQNISEKEEKNPESPENSANIENPERTIEETKKKTRHSQGSYIGLLGQWQF